MAEGSSEGARTSGAAGSHLHRKIFCRCGEEQSSRSTRGTVPIPTTSLCLILPCPTDPWSCKPLCRGTHAAIFFPRGPSLPHPGSGPEAYARYFLMSEHGCRGRNAIPWPLVHLGPSPPRGKETGRDEGFPRHGGGGADRRTSSANYCLQSS